MPVRVQLRRTKGWRKPDGVVVVSRPSRWGNAFGVPPMSAAERADAVARYRQAVAVGALGFTVEDVRRELAGKDLACWCAVEDECHADVLLELANHPPSPTRRRA